MSLSFVHRFVPAATLAAPTVLALHGTGGDESDLVPLARMLSADSAILSPRGAVLENGMPRFFRRIAEGVFDQEDLRRRTDDLADFIAKAAAHYGFDPTRVVALGYSNGANIAASLLLSKPSALAGAVLLRPMVPFEPAALPALKTKRILISAGRQDPMVPQPSTERLAALLTQAGADVTVSWFDTGHALLPREMEQAARWFNERFA
ncbi:MAG TPA: alpha/beta hydrolase [Vicinamibacterales bacterium]|nr:alpha/beta hydrolase [Vicinamibacterales bacterium]